LSYGAAFAVSLCFFRFEVAALDMLDMTQCNLVYTTVFTLFLNCRQQVSSERGYFSTRLHGITPQTTVIFLIFLWKICWYNLYESDLFLVMEPFLWHSIVLYYFLLLCV
jgi:hypothetical protein